MMRSRLMSGLIIVLAAALVGCAAKPKETGFLSSYEKLEPVKGSDTFLRYVAPNNELAKYQSFLVDPIAVKFYDPKEEKDVKPEDIAHLQQFFYQQITEQLTEHGFKLVSAPGPGVAIIRVAITDLKKGTPALNVLPQTKLTGLGLGAATVEAEIVDSQSDNQLAAAVISDTGSRLSFSGLSAWGDVESLMKEWSKKLATRLADAREGKEPK